jgi:hypothetical protein
MRAWCATHFADANMQIVYDSQHYHVIEYTGIGGYELTNKSEHVCAYFHGPRPPRFATTSQKSLPKIRPSILLTSTSAGSIR